MISVKNKDFSRTKEAKKASKKIMTSEIKDTKINLENMVNFSNIFCFIKNSTKVGKKTRIKKGIPVIKKKSKEINDEEKKDKANRTLFFLKKYKNLFLYNLIPFFVKFIII